MGYQTIETPQGAFVGWGDKPGQIIEGRVTDYDPVGGKDFGGDVCPSVELELTRTGHSLVKGTWTTYEAGELVTVTCGQAQLKKKVRKAEPRIGDLLYMELGEKIRVPAGEVKSFIVQIDKAGGSQRAAAAPAAGQPGYVHEPGPSNDSPPPPPDDEPPF